MAERVWFTLIKADARQAGRAALLTLRIVRSSDGYFYDWNDGTFVSVLATTYNQAATEHDATNNAGAYYWTLGAGSIDHIFPAAFTDDEYIFEVEDSSLPVHVSYAVFIRNRRLPDVLMAMVFQNKKALSEGATGNMIYYEDDGSTVMLIKNVKDKSGGSIRLDPGVPAQEEPA